MGEGLAVLDERGLLDVPSPGLAAQQFAGATRPPDEAELADVIDAGVAAFLRAYAAA